MSTMRGLAPRVAVVALALAWPVAPGATPQAEASVLERFDFGGGARKQGRLPRALHEASGLATTADGRVFVHGDERGLVAQVDPCTGVVVKAFTLGSPPVRGDFEGIAIAGDRFFLITSLGILYETREGANGAAMPFTMTDTGFGNACEIEGLAWDAPDRALVVGCKTPRTGAFRDRVTLLRWSLDRGAPAAPPQLGVPMGDVARKGFAPSAVERDAKTGHLLVVAGQQRELVELSAPGRVVAARKLDRDWHAQPEGLTLVGDSLLVVADEGGERRATITCYRRVR